MLFRPRRQKMNLRDVSFEILAPHVLAEHVLAASKPIVECNDLGLSISKSVTRSTRRHAHAPQSCIWKWHNASSSSVVHERVHKSGAENGTARRLSLCNR